MRYLPGRALLLAAGDQQDFRPMFANASQAAKAMSKRTPAVPEGSLLGQLPPFLLQLEKNGRMSLASCNQEARPDHSPDLNAVAGRLEVEPLATVINVKYIFEKISAQPDANHNPNSS